MINNEIIQVSRISSKGQVTIPKNIRDIIGVEPGDMIAYITNGKDEVRLINATLVADKMNAE